MTASLLRSLRSLTALSLLALGSSLLLVGCGGEAEVETTDALESQYDSAESLRGMFESVAQTGEHPGSGMAGVDDAVAGIEDPEKKAAIEKAVAGINRGGSPQARKAAAQDGLNAL